MLTGYDNTLGRYIHWEKNWEYLSGVRLSDFEKSGVCFKLFILYFGFVGKGKWEKRFFGTK